MLEGSWTLIYTHRDRYDGNITAMITESTYRCDICGGDGRDPDDSDKLCPQCEGEGEVTVLE